MVVIKYIDRKLSFTLILLCTILSLGSCDEENNVTKLFGVKKTNVTSAVALTSSTAIPGGVKIIYKTSNDRDLMYVKVQYKLDSGRDTLLKASKYGNTLTILGFGNSEAKNISFSAVDRYGNESKPSYFNVTPGIPSFQTIAKSLSTQATYGGIRLQLENIDKEKVVIKVEVRNNRKRWTPFEVDTVSNKNIQLTVRGLKPVLTSFRISVGDLYGHFSNPVEVTHIPIPEQEIDRNRFRKIILPTDLPVDGWGCRMENIWNGVVEWGSFNLCHSDEFDEFPQWFTFDLGITTKLSRYKYWQRLEEKYLYQHANMKSWEIWGRSDKPNPDGSWDGWKKLLKCESYKPSNLPLGLVSKEDMAYAAKGEEFEFGRDTPPVRYIRIKVLSTFSGVKTVHFQQLKFWGID